MTFAEHFSDVGDELAPQPWMQLRQVQSGLVESVSKSYDPNDGTVKNDFLQSLTVQWTNNTPVSQWVYGMVSKSGSQVTLQARSRGYLSTRHGVTVGSAGAAVPMTEVSRFGVGSDLGNGGLLTFGGEYGISELRQNSMTVPLMPQITGWFLVAPSETFNAAVDVTFISENWENTPIAGGDADTESKVITGDVRLDLFAIPTVTTPPARVTPTIVGGLSNVKTATTLTDSTTVTTPSNLTTDDMLIAVVANGLGLANDTTPVQSGWSLLHSRSASGPLGILNGVNLRIYARRITTGTASSYSFTNSFGAEQIAVLLALRNSVPLDAAEGLNWYVSSTLTSYNFFNTFQSQAAPSINRAGQLLLTLSYFSHASLQLSIPQSPPSGMTEIIDCTGALGSLSLAYLNSPPTPTQDRTFIPAIAPDFNGYAVAASIVVPGARL